MRILHLDIETAPNIAYVWSLFSDYVSIDRLVEPGYTLCWSAKWQGEKDIMFSSVHHDGMQAMIGRIHSLLDEADAVVHYNGQKFDIPTLNREFINNDFTPPMPYHQIDLYRVVRKRFRYASNKLDFVAQQLGLGGKTKHKGMELWSECMAGNEEAWATMEEYNKRDVEILEDLYNKLLPWIQNHPNHALYMDTTRPTCTNCGSDKVIKKGVETTKTGQYQRYRCTSCGTPLRGRYTMVTKEKREHVLSQSRL
jgi:DNA polymerase elongation subunit (family B)